MSDKKMLQAILDKVTTLDQKVDKGFGEVDKRFGEVNKRIDKLGLELAELSDDLPAMLIALLLQVGAPTVEEFDTLDKRVSKLETNTVSV